jgi:light-regulated signal transduction histidine kinase (bacteriophytochrome)
MLLTSLADPHDVIRGLACGADAFITKPYREEHLLARIDYLLTNRSPCCQGTSDDGLAIEFGGQKYCITADRRQILDLLLSTYETAMQKNTELIKARDELSRLNEQLETANRDLEAFNYTVSHDLRGPLTNISGYSQALRDICAETLDEQAKDFVKEIYQATLRMDKMIGALLSFAKMNHRVLKLESVDLSMLALVIATDLRYRDMQRKVNVTIAEGVVAEGDTVLLRVVMENLLGNAWKYTGKREMAEISFGEIETCGERTFFVRDNGAGFDMDQADRLFDAFERLHSGEEFEGSGIGLATVQRIIQRHGGRIWAEGEVGRGATFYFTL